MADDNLLTARDGAVLTLTINRPKVMNALNAETLGALDAAMASAAADADIRVIVLTGAGDRAFVAGADINELAVQTPVGGREHARRGQRFDRIEQLGKPVIAAVNGFALSGLRAGHGTMRLRPYGEVRAAGDQSRLILAAMHVCRDSSAADARELLLTGATISADRPIASDSSIASCRRRISAEARTLAQLLASKAPVAARYILDAVAGGLDMSFADAQTYEATLFGLVATTEDMREGTRAFLEKRKPTFTGR
jgi:enoyl-CoA hydratase